MFYRIFSIPVLMLLYLVSSAQAVTPLESQCKSGILLDATSGDIIFEQNARRPFPPASMVKMMTAYLLMKRVEDGVVRFSDTIETSAAASKIGGSQVYLKHGEKFTLEQLLQAVMVQSANDASTAIAEYLGGSTVGFIDMMNAQAEKLGMEHTTFHTPHGLPPAKGQEADLASAHDLAILGRAIVTEYPSLLEMSGNPKASFRDASFQMTNTNKLLNKFKGADGIKTGYYHKAGFCITATAERNGVRMIAVVMGCKSGRKRFEEAARLLTLGFSQYKRVELIKKNSPIDTAIPVANGDKKWLVPVAAETFASSVRIEDVEKITHQEDLLPILYAPLTPNSKCGSISFYLGEKELGSVDLVLAEPVAKLGVIGRLARLLKLR